MLERFKVPEKDRVYVSEKRIRAATEGILRHSGVPSEEAVSSADVLIKNDLRGVESHVVFRDNQSCYVQRHIVSERNLVGLRTPTGMGDSYLRANIDSGNSGVEQQEHSKHLRVTRRENAGQSLAPVVNEVCQSRPTVLPKPELCSRN